MRNVQEVDNNNNAQPRMKEYAVLRRCPLILWTRFALWTRPESCNCHEHQAQCSDVQASTF